MAANQQDLSKKRRQVLGIFAPVKARVQKLQAD